MVKCCIFIQTLNTVYAIHTSSKRILQLLNVFFSLTLTKAKINHYCLNTLYRLYERFYISFKLACIRNLSRLQLASANRVAALTSRDCILWIQGIPKVIQIGKQVVELDSSKYSTPNRERSFSHRYWQSSTTKTNIIADEYTDVTSDRFRKRQIPI